MGIKKVKKVTMEELARTMKHGFSDAKKHTDSQVEELARMVQNGFSDLKKIVVTKTEFADHQKVVINEFHRLNAEVKDIKTTLGPTVVIVAEQEKGMQNLESRLDHVEQKVGIVRLSR